MAIDLEKIKKQRAKPVMAAVKNTALPALAEAKVDFSFKKLYLKLQSIGTVSGKDKIFFVQNLQVMIRSGLPLDRSLKTLADQTRNKYFQKIIADLASQTEKGIAFAQSLGKYQKVFGDLFINMVEAGEVSGRLEDVLSQLYVQIKKLQELKSRVISAMTYPVIVTVAMVGIGIGMMIFVVPKITTIFEDMSAELPAATKLLINISNFIVNNGVASFLIFFAFIIFLVISLKARVSNYFYHALFLKLPVFGPIIKKINLAKFSRTLSSLIKTDIPIVKSFEITAQILGNRLYKKSLMESVEEVKAGLSLTEVLKKYPKLYPPVIIQMTAAGEETGTVDEVLGELAGFYEDEIDQIMKTLPSIIEPILILALGAAVAVMAVAIIMPMYTLTQHIN